VFLAVGYRVAQAPTFPGRRQRIQAAREAMLRKDQGEA
jgi:hypothetical protein